ncbi:MAG: LamG domain-containing protein [Alteromonadales bacterium]|nr:LamG domain-containing protein [Alteromonadales bacterium]
MANAQIWDSNLTDGGVAVSAVAGGEIATLYNNGTPYTGTQPQAANLQGWWKLDADNSTWDGSDWEILDDSTNSNDGLSDGMTTANLIPSNLTRSIPYSSYSMEFDGVNDSIALDSELSYSGEFSVSMWLYITDDTGGRVFLGNSTGGDGFLYIKAGVGHVLYIGSGDLATQFNNTAFTVNEWAHLAVTRDASDVFRAYKNGVLTDTSAADAGTFAFNQLGLYGTNSYEFEGNMCQVAAWSTTLSLTNVQTLYNYGVPNDISSLSPVSWWSLAGDSYYNGSDWICPDLGSGGNNGTSDGMGGTELVGNGPGSTANGIATSMDIPTNLKGEAPNSTSNAISINMTAVDRVTSVPG